MCFLEIKANLVKCWRLADVVSSGASSVSRTFWFEMCAMTSFIQAITYLWGGNRAKKQPSLRTRADLLINPKLKCTGRISNMIKGCSGEA